MEKQLCDPQLLTPDFSKPEVRKTDSLMAEVHLLLFFLNKCVFIQSGPSAAPYNHVSLGCFPGTAC